MRDLAKLLLVQLGLQQLLWVLLEQQQLVQVG